MDRAEQIAASYDGTPATKPGPAGQFYFADWLADPHVQGMSRTARGLYIDALALAWVSEPPCSLPADPAELRRCLGGEDYVPNRFMDAAAVARQTDEWMALWGEVAGRWVEYAGRLWNRRLCRVYLEQMEYRTASKGRTAAATEASRRRHALRNGGRDVERDEAERRTAMREYGTRDDKPISGISVRHGGPIGRVTSVVDERNGDVTVNVALSATAPPLSPSPSPPPALSQNQKAATREPAPVREPVMPQGEGVPDELVGTVARALGRPAALAALAPRISELMADGVSLAEICAEAERVIRRQLDKGESIGNPARYLDRILADFRTARRAAQVALGPRVPTEGERQQEAVAAEDAWRSSMAARLAQICADLQKAGFETLVERISSIDPCAEDAQVRIDAEVEHSLAAWAAGLSGAEQTEIEDAIAAIATKLRARGIPEPTIAEKARQSRRGHLAIKAGMPTTFLHAIS